MSTSEVTRDGLRGTRPGRDAVTNQTGRRRKGGERAMVPPADFNSYYGRPVVKVPTWKALDIAGYIFLGGLAGASSTLAAGAEMTGRRGLAKHGKLGAIAAISLGTVGLIHDLGRPSRFANMLRVMKPTSPMNMGSWLLGAYAPAAGVAAGTSVLGRFPRLGTAATLGAGVLGPAVASYTAVLISDTATPAWHEGRREMPFVFAGSAAAAAGGLGLLTTATAEAGPAARAGIVGAAAELIAVERMKKRVGVVAGAYETGRARTLMQAGKALGLAGIAMTLVGRRSRVASAVGGAALLAASACTRFGIFEAGKISAADPKYTVVPQRERMDRTARMPT
jgi:formate-dependent nitrite reductase membrane component NrfD